MAAVSDTATPWVTQGGASCPSTEACTATCAVCRSSTRAALAGSCLLFGTMKCSVVGYGAEFCVLTSNFPLTSAQLSRTWLHR